MVSSRWAVIGARPLLRLINSVTVQTSLTRERYKLGTATKELERKGKCDLYRGLAMAQVGVCGAGDAQLVLKHRENTNGETRIVAFVGSPIDNDPRLMKFSPPYCS